MSSLRAALITTCVAVMTLTACGGGAADDEQYQGVCLDPRTELRLDDDACDDTDDEHAAWVFFLVAAHFPAVGAKASGYTSKPRAGHYTTGGAPKSGGVIVAPRRPAQPGARNPARPPAQPGARNPARAPRK